MSGFGGQYGAPASAWQEHHTPDGRAYYYNATTKVTQWTKPEDMMSGAEKALASQPWKEYTAEGGRKYWYNTETKQSSWEMPEAFKQALGEPEGTATPAPQSRQDDRHGDYDDQRDYRDHRDRDRDRDRDYREHREPREREHRATFAFTDPKAKAFVPASNDPDYASLEEAEQAFHKLLRRSNVGSDWTWEQAIRATAKDPQFRAIKDPKDRRVAFEKYCQEMVDQDKERAEERLNKLRADFETMLKRHPEITHYTRWKTARPMIEGETIFRSSNNDNERRQLFEEYIVSLKRSHKEQQANMRKSAMDGLLDLLPKLNLEAYTRWPDARDIISSTEPFQSEDKYKTLSNFDILTAFQNHMKALERAFNDRKQDEKNKKYRQERKARDGFKKLLTELRNDKKIKPGTTWSQLLPTIESDERYTAMAGHAGSTAQELFWDVMEEEERTLRGPRNDILDVLEDKRVEITPTSEIEEFMSIMKDDQRTANIDTDILTLLFKRLREKRNSKRDDERPPDRHQRRAMDDLRVHLKRMEPPITASETYDKVRSRLVNAEEFQALDSEELRRSAFDKHIRRLREKEEEAERGPRRGSVDRDGPRRDRSRGGAGDRSHRGGGGRRRSRSPPPDPYEADRRRAIAEREKNHRKSTMAETLVSGDTRTSNSGRGSPRRERDRDHDRAPRSRREDDGHYDRERRDREEDRERQFRRRGAAAADRGSYDELNYGDDRQVSGARRRRPEDEDDYDRRDSRDSKRIRRDRSRDRSPPPREAEPKAASAAAAKGPPTPAKDAMSGSEEGEIEE